MNQHLKLLCLLLLILCSFSSGCDKKDDDPTECEQNCNLEPEVGPCNAAFPRYYYDKTEKKCKQFTWGGCAGVVPFETMEECESCGCK
jgi:Kunitz/Bovine pancreatic trypsin inhibitor domain